MISRGGTTRARNVHLGSIAQGAPGDFRPQKLKQFADIIYTF